MGIKTVLSPERGFISKSIITFVAKTIEYQSGFFKIDKSDNTVTQNTGVENSNDLLSRNGMR